MIYLHPIIKVELFDIWWIDFMIHFVSSYDNKFILVVIIYLYKWVEVVALLQHDCKIMVCFIKMSIFTKFGTPRAIISDKGSYFCNQSFESLLKKYRVKHKVAIPYYLQTCKHVEILNHKIKNILAKMVNVSR